MLPNQPRVSATPSASCPIHAWPSAPASASPAAPRRTHPSTSRRRWRGSTRGPFRRTTTMGPTTAEHCPSSWGTASMWGTAQRSTQGWHAGAAPARPVRRAAWAVARRPPPWCRMWAGRGAGWMTQPAQGTWCAHAHRVHAHAHAHAHRGRHPLLLAIAHGLSRCTRMAGGWAGGSGSGGVGDSGVDIGSLLWRASRGQSRGCGAQGEGRVTRTRQRTGRRLPRPSHRRQHRYQAHRAPNCSRCSSGRALLNAMHAADQAPRPPAGRSIGAMYLRGRNTQHRPRAAPRD